MENIKEEDVLVGIDLGTSNINIGIYLNNQIKFISYKNKLCFPSIISLDKESTRIIDNEDIYKNIEEYLANVIYDFKLLVGLNYEELIKKEFYKNLIYEISEINGVPKIKIKSNEKLLYFSVEEVYTLIFIQLIKSTENFILNLGKKIKIKKVFITAPKFFSEQQKKVIETAALSAGIENPKIIDEPFAEIL